MNILLADSGSTKSEWCMIGSGKRKMVDLQGISPYFLDQKQMLEIFKGDLLPRLGGVQPDSIYYYGTGCGSAENRKMVARSLKLAFGKTHIEVTHDLVGAARALCGDKKGIACILGTGSNSCYYNGKRIIKNSPGLGYILGDEGSGAYLGKKVLQYYLYKTFDEELRYKFDAAYTTNKAEILENLYKRPFPNKYLASFALFLADNRGHYMIENILEDGLNDFFFCHLCKYQESWKHPIHFVGSVSFGFRDVIRELAKGYEFEMGRILKKPMDGLVEYHS